MSRKRASKGDVQWFMPKKKRPFAYSTRATSDLVGVLSQEHETIQQVYNAIHYDADAKAILQEYINAGYGQVEAKKWFRF